MYTFTKLLSIFLCGTTLIGAAKCAELPPFITPCSMSLSYDQFSNCATSQGRNAQSKLVKGLPELGLEPLDPLKLTSVEAKAGTFTIKSTNVVLKGLEKVEIRELRMDLKKKTGITNLFGNLTFVSDYETEGRVLFFPINGNGKLSVKIYDTEIIIKYKIRMYKDENGVEHLEIYDSKPHQKYGNVQIHMSNLLGGETIGETINQVLNENWRELMKDVGPPYFKAATAKVDKNINKLLRSVPYDKVIVP